MWKIYDVTNGLGHTFCNDIVTARNVLKAIYNELKSNCPSADITLREGVEIKYYLNAFTGPFYYEIKEVDVWNRVPDFLAKYSEADEK